MRDIDIVKRWFCTDFELQPIETDGEDDHVRLPVEYLPKVVVSNLVNSVKDVSSHLLRKERPVVQKRCFCQIPDRYQQFSLSSKPTRDSQ